MSRGLVLAAPRSGSGKTVLTLGILRALRRQGTAIAAAKVGPDYIDAAFHARAAGAECVNLDPWAMRAPTLSALFAGFPRDAFVLCEGAMGLFDGAGIAASGSTADLAQRAGWPVVLVVDVEGIGASLAALVEGFQRHRPELRLAALILNRVASPRHGAILKAALERVRPSLQCLGAVPRDATLALPSRHLGLVQAEEHAELERFLDRAADVVATHVDLVRLTALAAPTKAGGSGVVSAPLPPIGQFIAIARDAAFSFAYPAVLAGWRAAGRELAFFSPLADESPPRHADAVYLAGGYPELHAARLAAAPRFLGGLREAARRGATLYGECGGYMALGRTLVDGTGRAHAMAGLLPLETSIAEPRLHLGYRAVELAVAGPLGEAGARFRGHEFHYASVVSEASSGPLFRANDADGVALGTAGLRQGNVMGSFIHLIDRGL